MSSIPLSTLPNLTNHIITRKDSYPHRGAFGNVLRCIWRPDLSTPAEHEVAVKTIQVPPERRREIVHENLITWRRLNHKNIARLLGITSGFGNPATSISMVSFWFANGTLTTFLTSQHDTISERQRLELLQGIADGLLYLHTSEVVHGNLSGNNVLIDSQGKACLTNFGLSTVCGGFVQSATYIGCPGAIRWAAPEFFIGVGQHSTFESDIYSFGSIMLQVLSGEIPWSEVKTEHLICKKLADWKTPRQPSSISQKHWTFIRRCWSPSPRNSANPSFRPSAFQIVDFLKTTDTHVRHSPDATLCHAMGSMIRWITTRFARPASRPSNDAATNSAAKCGSTDPNSNQDLLTLDECTVTDTFVCDDTRNKNFDVENFNEHPVIRQNTDTNQQSSSNSANTSTHPNLEKKRKPLAFEGDLVNQIIRLHEFAEVAVQVIHLDPARPDLRTKLLRRHRKWLELEHQNLVRFFGLTSSFGFFPALVTTWMSQGILTTYLDSQYPSLDLQQKFSLANDIISGLCYVHSQNIVHGHLTGFNVLIDESGRACLANYDLADLLATHYSVVQEPRWTDPELISGERSQLPTVSTDIYAFGCIMLQILIGKLPYWWIRKSLVIIAKSENQLPMQDDPNDPMLEDSYKEFLKRCWAPTDSRALSAEVAEFVAAQLRALDES
ncbi:kinase-like protein [Suillus brevipes Sb2]|nr:kinase-like protein [Suillus brevipes Sb2]